MVPFWGHPSEESPRRPWQDYPPLDREESLPLHVHGSAASSGSLATGERQGQRGGFDLDEYLHSLEIGDPEEHRCPVTCAPPAVFLPGSKQRRGVRVSLSNFDARPPGDREVMERIGGVDWKDDFDEEEHDLDDPLMSLGPGTRREPGDVGFDDPSSPSASRARWRAGTRGAMVTAAVLVLSSCTYCAALACRRSWHSTETFPGPDPLHQSRWPPGSSAQHFQVKAGVKVAPEGDNSPSCSHSVDLSDFSSQQAMTDAGWRFNWSDTFTFKPSIYKGFMPQESYWGFSSDGYASLSLRLHGFGNATLDFGNLLGTTGSNVSVLRNLAVVASAGASTLSKVVSIPFAPEDELRIVENPRGIIILNSVEVRCLSRSQEVHGKVVSDAPDPDVLQNIKDLHLSPNKSNVTSDEAAWREVYSSLQAEAQKAQEKTKEHYAIVHQVQVYRDMKDKLRDKVSKLTKQHQQQLEYARSELKQRVADREHFKDHLEALLDSPTEKSRLAALLSRQMDSSHLQKSEDIKRILTEASRLTRQAKALAIAVTEEALTSKSDDHLASEARTYIRSTDAKVSLQSRTILEAEDVSKSLEELRRNQTWVTRKLDAAAKEDEQNRAALAEIAQREEVLEKEEAKAAKVLKEAMATAEKVAKEERERLARERRKHPPALNETETPTGVLGEGDQPLHRAVDVGTKLLFKQQAATAKFHRYSDLSEKRNHGDLANSTKVEVLRVGTSLARVRSDDGGEYEVPYQDLYHMPHEEAPSTTTTTTTALLMPTTTTHALVFLRPTLYCFSLILPFGYEADLMLQQQQKGVGIFACDQAVVFSNSSTFLGSGRPLPVKVQVVSQSLSVPYGGRWHTALNRDVFNRVWQEVVHDGTYRRYDWIVKADADTVFFPSRLLEVLQTGWSQPTLEAIVRKRKLQVQEKKTDTCSTCRLWGHESELCSDHARWLQEHKSMSCQDALAQIAREPPLDCGCDCNAIEACDLAGNLAWASDGGLLVGEGFEEVLQKVTMRGGDPGSISSLPVYINDCQFGLHGPLEVLSAAAVTTYVERLPECDYLLDEPWGEDKFLDRCMLTLGVTRANDFSLLSETACGEEPAPCGTPDVAFHPFKLAEDYFACWSFAHAFGHGPASPREEGRTSKLLGYGTQEPVYVIGSQGEGG